MIHRLRRSAGDRRPLSDVDFKPGCLNLVRIALKRPYTFVVMALLILIVGPLAALRTPTDIFPEIRIPVIAVVWSTPACRPTRCRAGSC